MSRTTHPEAKIDPTLLMTPCRLSVCQALYSRIRKAWPTTPYFVWLVEFEHKDSEADALFVRVTFQAGEGLKVRTHGFQHRIPWADVTGTPRKATEGVDQRWDILKGALDESLAEFFGTEIEAAKASTT